jgi:FkbM family methyltransferase
MAKLLRRAPDFAQWMRAVRFQAGMSRRLSNWREVWASFRTGSTDPPPLKFRNGLILQGRAQDTPILLYSEVFASGCYRRLAPPCGGIVVDVGANVGAFTLDWLHRNPTAFVHSYEPDPDTCAVLRDNLARNGFARRAVVWNEAADRADGSVSFSRDTLTMGSRIGAGSLTVGSVSLSTVLRRAGGNIELLKMDAEGAEGDILEGGAAALPGITRVVGEYHPQLVPGVMTRVEAALNPSHICTVRNSRRCRSMFVAVRRERA